MIKKAIKSMYIRYKRRKVQKTYKRILLNNISQLKINGCRKNGSKNNILKKYKINDATSDLFSNYYASILGINSEKFISVPTYFNYIEPKLNISSFAECLADKNYYNRFFPDINTPTTFLRKIRGHFYDDTYNHINLSEQSFEVFTDSAPTIIIKASIDSGSGRNIEFYNLKNDQYENAVTKKPLTISYLESFPDFIVQEFVVQHEFFRKFNPDSNNTVRVLIYRSVKDDSIHILHRLFRVGAKGSYLDHDNLGGVAIGITTGHRLNRFATDAIGNKYYEYNNIKLGEVGVVPFMDKIEEMARTIAGQSFYARLLAIDFTIDDRGNPLLIEINTQGNGTSQYQMNNGPLFGEFTDEILEFCMK